MNVILWIVIAAALAGCAQPAEAVRKGSVEDAPFLAVLEMGPSDREYDFYPRSLVVALGREVRLTVVNAGQFPHSYVVHELGIESGTVRSGERTTLTFVARQQGAFESMCDVPGHYEAGMKGTLAVR